MTIAYRLKRKKYLCDICGKVDFWDENWSWYGSIAMEEICIDDIPTACSKTCKQELDARISDGRIKLPQIKFSKDYPLGRVTAKRKGY